MWTPDIRTLFLVLFLVNVFLTLMLASFWKTQKTYEGFSLWMLSLLVISCGYFLFTLRGSVSDLLSVVIANILIILSVLIRFDAIRRFFLARPLPVVMYGVLVPATIFFLYFTYGVDSVIIRAVITNVVLVPLIIVICILGLQIHEKESRVVRLGFFATLIIIASFLVVRLISWLVVPGEHSLLETTTPNFLFFTGGILTDILLTGFFLMLNMARSQAELRLSEERYRSLADNLPDYVVVHDGTTIRYTNPAAAQLVGQSTESLVGQSIYSFLTPVSADAVQNGFRNASSRDVLIAPGEVDLQLTDDTIRHCLVKTVRINFQGSPLFLSVVTDITERRAVEVALSVVNKKLNILASVTRHDIKNQLVALSGYLTILKESPGKVSDIPGHIEKALEITGTIGHQIDFTKIYEDMGTTAPVWQDLSVSIRQSIASRPTGQAKIVIDLPGIEIYADHLVGKVFYNLLDNALRYGGGKMTTIRFSSRETNAGLILTCEDDGEGISPEDKKHLFTRGFGKNTGLGLFLSREILSITGISIAETSGTGAGARFEIVVPKGAYRFVGA